jgi:hypothetical protein
MGQEQQEAVESVIPRQRRWLSYRWSPAPLRRLLDPHSGAVKPPPGEGKSFDPVPGYTMVGTDGSSATINPIADSKHAPPPSLSSAPGFRSMKGNANTFRVGGSARSLGPFGSGNGLNSAALEAAMSFRATSANPIKLAGNIGNTATALPLTLNSKRKALDGRSVTNPVADHHAALEEQEKRRQRVQRASTAAVVESSGSSSTRRGDYDDEVDDFGSPTGGEGRGRRGSQTKKAFGGFKPRPIPVGGDSSRGFSSSTSSRAVIGLVEGDGEVDDDYERGQDQHDDDEASSQFDWQGRRGSHVAGGGWAPIRPRNAEQVPIAAGRVDTTAGRAFVGQIERTLAARR